jgi:hypothetical protein
MAGWAPRAAVVAAHLVVALIMTWPYVNYSAFGTSSYGGDQRLIIWTLAWDNHALLSSASLFQSNIFFPAADSLRYNEHLFGLSLFTLPWTMAGASPVLAHHAVWWLAFPLNGLAAQALVYRFARSAHAAFAGSLVFAYSFYVMLHAHGHLNLIWLWPLPLSLLLLEKWFDAPTLRRLSVWTAVMLLQILTSWYLAVMILIANALFGAVLIVSLGRRSLPSRPAGNGAGWRRRVAHLVVAAAVSCAAVYPFARQYADIASAPAEIVGNSAELASYVIPPANTVTGRWWAARINSEPGSIFGERTLFAGWTALALGAIGLVVLLRGQRVDLRACFLPLLTLVAGLISFGPSLPLLGPTALAPFNWLADLPGLDGIRAPARFAALAMLGLAGLVGVGGAWLVHRPGGRGRVLLSILLPLMLLEWFVVDFPAGKPELHAVPPIYRTPEVRAARSLVSLPDYTGTTDWVLGGDYLYYSTAHWRPIVNGFGRTSPRGHDEVIATVRAFPSSAAAMRRLGIQHVIIHADRFSDGARDLLDAATKCRECRLVMQLGSDHLFEIVP